MKKILAIITALCLVTPPGEMTAAHGATPERRYSSRTYTTFDGLPSSRCRNIVQDGDGFIWISGAGAFARFDGFGFTDFSQGRDVNIYRLDRDPDGRVRAFSRNLIYTVGDDGSLRTQVVADSLDATIYTSFGLPDGYSFYTDWEGNNQALFEIDGDGNLEKVLEHPLLAGFGDVFQTFYDDGTGDLYLFGETETTLITRDGAASSVMEGVYARGACKRDGALYVVGLKGIFRFEDGVTTPLLRTDLDIQVLPLKVMVDGRGTIYFNNEDVLYRFDGRGVEEVFRTNYILDFIMDGENNLWVSTMQGVCNLFGLGFETYTLPDPNDAVRSVVWDPVRKAVVAATLNGYIYEAGSDGDIAEVDCSANSPGSTFFYDYSAARDGAIFLPGPNDVLRLDGQGGRWLGLPALSTLRFVVTLPNGNLLEGGGTYLVEFTPDGDVVRDYGVRAMGQSLYAPPCVDAKGRLWLGGGSGVTIYDHDAHRIVNTIFTDSVKIVRFMAADGAGNVHFSSENRLFVSSGDSVRLKRTFPQLIKGIYFTRRDGRMIVTTPGGFYLFDAGQGDPIFFNHENGYTGGEPSSGSLAEDDAGNIYMPSLGGLFRFNPDDLLSAPVVPRLKILSARASVDNVSWEPLGEGTDGAVRLGWRHNNVRFDFLGLSYTAAQSVRYSWRLVGFQDEWSKPSTPREAAFSNLPPGDYLFEVVADTPIRAGAHSDTASVAFTIRPAVWQTAWFPTVCALLLIVGGAAAALVVLRRKNRSLLEKQRAEKELNELRISAIRLRAIPHFNANVLAAIEYYIANRTKEEAMHILGIYSEFTLKTLGEVDRAARSLDDELAYVKIYLELEKIRFMEKFDYYIEIDPEVDRGVHLPNMILHTWCENAVKHGIMPLHEGGIIIIRATQRDGTVKISVEDNGIGRARAAANPHLHSSKQGLSILERQIDIYNRFSDHKINHRVDDLTPGTRFTVEVPLGFTYLN